MDFLKSPQVFNICILILVTMTILYLMGVIPLSARSKFGGAFGDGTVPLIGGNVNDYVQTTTAQLVH